MNRRAKYCRNPLATEFTKRIDGKGTVQQLEETLRFLAAFHEAGHAHTFYGQGGYVTRIETGKRRGWDRSVGGGMTFGPAYGAHAGTDRATALLEAKASIAGPIAHRLLVPSGLKSCAEELRKAHADLQYWGHYTKPEAIQHMKRLAAQVRHALINDFPRLQAMALWIYRHPCLEGTKIRLMEHQLGLRPSGKKTRARLQEPEGREWLTQFTPTIEALWAELPAMPEVPQPWGVFDEGGIVEALEKLKRPIADAPIPQIAWGKPHHHLAVTESKTANPPIR